MSFLFGSKKSDSQPAPAPAPVPVAPTAPDNSAAEAERKAAADAQTAEYAAAGRRATIVGGALINDSQKDGIFAPAKKRAAAREILG